MTKQDLEALQKSLSIRYDDGVLSISLADRFDLRLAPGEDGLSLSDAHGNALRMSPSGVSLSSKGKLTLSGEDGVSITGHKGVTVSAEAGDVAVKGLNVDLDAETSASLQGASTLTLRGAMVLIN